MEEWERIAKSLPCGRSVRVKCCRKDTSQVISHTEKGYTTYCFRCGPESRKFKSHGSRSLSELIQHKKELESYAQEAGELTLPEDFTEDIPKHVMAWLLRAGVSVNTAKMYGFGWSPKMGRIVLPVWDEGELIAVQARAVYKGQKPKYLNKKGSNRRSPVFRSLRTSLYEPVAYGLVITEDILSTVRVGKLVPSLSTLGTNLSEHTVVQLLKEGVNRVYVWYDGDEAGRRGAKKARRTLQLLGMPCSLIETELDPKEYNNDEISRFIIESKEGTRSRLHSAKDRVDWK